MLAYVLALVIGLGSLALYLAAFFFPEVHRKEDFIWSGIGLFYALVLWVCAGRITGGVLLGQLASVALLGWFGWQTLTLRRLLVPQEQQTAIPSQDELKGKLEKVLPAGGVQGLQERVTSLFRKSKSEAQTTPTVVEPQVTQTTVQEKIDSEPDEVAATEEEVTAELVPPHPPSPELVEAAQKSADTADSGEAAAIPVEEIAPEAELAPPAEPTGPGDPEDRKAEP
ncbi:MAG TPA: Ycf66 family protein [Coleofasciculaceae cyanobacterium]|jgi:hypothetical protein